MDISRHHPSAAAHRRQQQIEDCLFEKMQHKPYASISVAELCRQVGISRKAFYNYYADKDACFYAIVDRYAQNALLHVATAVPENAGALAHATALMEYWRAQKPFWDVVVQNNLLHFLLLQGIEYVMTEEKTFMDVLSTPEVKSDVDILCCYTSIQLTLVLQWYLRGFDTPAEEMALKLLRLVYAPMISWEETRR